jgi:hypothetical protein
VSPDDQLRLLADRAEIADVIHRYATGLDRRDWRLYRDVFTDEFDNYTNTGEIEHLTADAWVERWRPVFEGYDATQHLMGNNLFDVHGDEATCVTYVQARHVIVEGGVTEAYVIGGYYTNRFRRTATGWKIAVRQLTVTWSEGDRGLSARAAARGRQRLGMS